MMGQLIDDLLALSRLGKEALSLSQLIDLEDLTRDVWEELKAGNPDRPVDLKIGHVPPGMGDRSLIRQVLVNILSNAVKFTGFGKFRSLKWADMKRNRECVLCPGQWCRL